MMELLFIAAFFFILLRTGISLPGILLALLLASVVMLAGGMFLLFLKLLPWLLLVVALVWVIRITTRKTPERYRARRRWYY